jgi:hypothetical protein
MAEDLGEGDNQMLLKEESQQRRTKVNQLPGWGYSTEGESLPSKLRHQKKKVNQLSSSDYP